MASNAALEYIPIILFPQMNDQHLPPEIPTESHHLPYGYTTGALHFQFEKKRQQVTVTTVDRLLGLIPMVILFLIVLFELYAYFYWHLIPLLEKNEGLRLDFWEGYDQSAWKYIFHLLSIILHAVIFLISTYRTMFTPPGHVPEDLKLEVDQVHGNKYHVMISEMLLRKMKKIGNMERKKTLFPRFCRNCLKVKPDRSHHCSICNTCVLKMDHHCPYINNCVGNDNYKYFMNLVISGTMASLQLTTTMWEGVLLAWDNSNYSIPFQVTFGIAYLGNVILSVVLVAFLCFHFYLISNATTTIEFREKLSVKFDVSPYHKGRWNNFLAIFGKNPLIWFLPISNNYLEPRMNSEAMSFLSSEQEK